MLRLEKWKNREEILENYVSEWLLINWLSQMKCWWWLSFINVCFEYNIVHRTKYSSKYIHTELAWNFAWFCNYKQTHLGRFLSSSLQNACYFFNFFYDTLLFFTSIYKLKYYLVKAMRHDVIKKMNFEKLNEKSPTYQIKPILLIYLLIVI